MVQSYHREVKQCKIRHLCRRPSSMVPCGFPSICIPAPFRGTFRRWRYTGRRAWSWSLSSGAQDWCRWALRAARPAWGTSLFLRPAPSMPCGRPKGSAWNTKISFLSWSFWAAQRTFVPRNICFRCKAGACRCLRG